MLKVSKLDTDRRASDIKQRNNNSESNKLLIFDILSKIQNSLKKLNFTTIDGNLQIVFFRYFAKIL